MHPVRVTCIWTRCTYQTDMRLPSQRKYFGCSSEFSTCTTTTINQGNSSVVPVLLKFVNDVYAKLKILHDYGTRETPNAMFCLPSPFPLQYEGMRSCPSLGTRLCLCRAFLFRCSYVHGPLSHLCKRSTVTLMYAVHCHTYVHGPLSHLCSRSTVTLMYTVHCHTYVHGSLSHFTKNICIASVTKSSKIMRLIVLSDKMINDGLDRI